MFRLHARFEHFGPSPSYVCSSRRRRLSGRAEPLTPIFVPAPHEFSREGSLLPGTHWLDQLFRELAADDLEQSVVRCCEDAAPRTTLADDVLEHHVDELRPPGCLIQVSLGWLERLRLG